MVLVGDDGREWSLSGVTLTDYHHLDAVVPAGLPAATYSLAIEGPSGSTGALADAFTATDTLADRLSVDVDQVSYEVFDQASLLVQLQDPDRAPVFVDMGVVVTVEAADGEVAAVFAEGSLVDQEPLTDAIGIRGRLRVDGSARIGLLSTTPDLLTVAVAPDNERSGVAEGVIKLEWAAGSPNALEIELPSDPLAVVAGERFPVTLTVVDEFGNEVEDPENVLLQDACDGVVVSEPMEIRGRTLVEVALETVTSPECPENRLKALLGPPGESGPITVAPGPVDHFEVDISSGEVTAGAELIAFVRAVDAYGNRTAWTGSLLVTDSVGGIAPDSFKCVGVGGSQFCRATPTVAAADVRLRVVDGEGIAGESAPYVVKAGDPTDLSLSLRTSPVTAGVPVAVTCTLTDTWDNIVDAATIPATDFLFADAAGPVTCVSTGTTTGGIAGFDCLFTKATNNDQLQAVIPSPLLSGSSSAFTVVNGALARVDITPAASSVVAGQSLLLDFVAFDAYDNPYIVKSSANVDLADTSGTISPAIVSLGGSGVGTLSATFTRAGLTEVTAWRSGVLLGTSSPIDVRPAATSGLSVGLDEPWAWVGEVTPVRVASVDVFGNTTDVDATATLTSTTGAASPAVASLVDGAGVAAVTWTRAETNETLSATTGTISGTSERLVVVSDCGGSGPTADVSFGGEDEAIACWDEIAGSATLSASMSGSAGSPVLYAVAVEDELAAISTTSPVAVEVGAVGVFALRALAVDAAGCGSEIASTAWIGPDDGEPVGPIALSSGVASLAIGSGTTPLTITGARNCTGDPATGGTVRLRTDRGELTGATSTGAGLGVVLDATGGGFATLDASFVTSGGLALAQADVPSGAAFGAVSVDLVGDDRAPVVWSQTPSGDVAGNRNELVLEFSEPLLTSSVVAANFSIAGPEPVSIGSVSLDGTRRTVTLDLSKSIDSGAGTWTVTALSTSGAAVRDDAGNRLDGTWSGVASSYAGTFGDLPSLAAAVTTCDPDRASFRPDGDDGVGAEADEVTLSIGSASTPEWWVITVADAGGATLRRDFVPATSASETWAWDGRDVGERIAGDGAYTITVDSDDGSGNRGGSCTTTISVDNGG